MICSPCRDGAQFYEEGMDAEAEAEHLNCPGGTWCECQHKKPALGPVYARS